MCLSQLGSHQYIGRGAARGVHGRGADPAACPLALGLILPGLPHIRTHAQLCARTTSRAARLIPPRAAQLHSPCSLLACQRRLITPPDQTQIDEELDKWVDSQVTIVGENK